ncbi:putative udp-galactose transporter protein [Phaeoacremonium minimum UCRPA7]|uniref:Putative udp-galactose transporter protein n=1 Tax=Phaeoacremonium minimum (strain UCR-PA7) TaxID=1286976 RepID=R8BVR0_PHAM7|nr:putative udp-galactose transporter protein [Phaeoacremonium minimum UCRPA7]EOO03364.1 putative udp-galactose transporter protein [Phaeoacremonium minimum UCRPA7]
MHYSRMMAPAGDHRYFTSTAVFLNEVIKLTISLTFAIYENSRSLAPQTPVSVVFEQIYNSVFRGDGWKLAIPATLYTLQNTLQYVALSNLDPVHFQILYELKILTTAFFSVILLARPLSPKRWLSLVVLTFGVSIVSLPSGTKDLAMMIHDTSDHFFPRSVHELGEAAGGMVDVARHLTRRTVEGLAGEVLHKRSATYQGIQEDLDTTPHMNYSIGLAAVLIASTVSGVTGVYFEKVLKDSPTPVSVWTRNIQLSFYSLFPALFVGVIWKDGDEIVKHGFFDGYNWVVWTTIVLQAIGGVLASLCIQYADNIAKNFATSISLVISFIFSVWFFNFGVSFTFILGTALVLLSTWLYSGPDRKRGRPPPINIVSYEKTVIASTPRITEESKLNLDPMDAQSIGLSTSRPATPLRSHSRAPSARGKSRDD